MSKRIWREGNSCILIGGNVSLWKILWRFLKIQLFWAHAKKIHKHQFEEKRTCTPRFMIALFTTVWNRKQPRYLMTGEYIKMMYTEEYYWTVKRWNPTTRKDMDGPRGGYIWWRKTLHDFKQMWHIKKINRWLNRTKTELLDYTPVSSYQKERGNWNE